MRFRYFLFFISLTAAALFADDSSDLDTFDTEAYSSILDLNAAPSATVGGVVNVITGYYAENTTDYCSNSANPIEIQRSYSNGSEIYGNLFGFWNLNISGKLKIKDKEGKYLIEVYDRGTYLPYYGKKSKEYFSVHKNILKKGVSNTAPPKISGLVNFKKKYVRLKESPPKTAMELDQAIFGKKYDCGYYLLTQVLSPTGCYTNYSYHKQDVNRIESFSKEGCLLSSIDIARPPVDPKSGCRSVVLTADDGKQVAYTLSPYAASSKKTLYSVSSVHTNFSPPVFYEYLTRKKQKPELMTKKRLPDGRFLQVEYQRGHHKKRRVRTLKAPIGTDETPYPLYTFKYKSRHANVRNALGNLTCYRWNKQDRLSKIEEHDDNDNLYRKEKFCWGSKGSYKDPTFLRCRHLLDQFGKVHRSKEFKTDRRGNVVKEILYGNLSGRGACRSGIHDRSGEKFVKTYEYDSYRRVKVEAVDVGEDGESCKQRILYAYHNNSSLVKLKQIQDNNQTKERTYYEYSPSGVAILEITDDGTSTDINDLTDVTERAIKRTKISPKGLPLEVVESYLDLSTGEEVQLGKIVNRYSIRGMLEMRKTYDAQNVLTFTEERRYNDYGLIAEEIDRGGRSTFYEYDANGNCIRKHSPHLAVDTLYTYDYSNRLIKEELHSADGIFATSYAYDLKGNRVKEIDPYGNETGYIYDSFDRVVSKIYPAILDIEGGLSVGKEKFSYNVLNHLREKIDLNGQRTAICTNLYGKPSRIIYPNGVRETRTYNKDGTLKTVLDPLKTKTHYEYDYKGRKTKEVKISSKGAVLSKKEWIYNAFHLIEEIDPEGNRTLYNYDDAGRLIRKRLGDAETLYVYDSLGREKEVWEKCGDRQYRISIVEYDLFDQIIEERVEDESGNLYALRQYAYDAGGNRTKEIIYHEGNISASVTEYNSFNQPVKQIAPDGAETLTHFDYEKVNAIGQRTLAETIIDPKGNLTENLYNARGAVVVREKRNIYAETVEKIEYFYNQLGKLMIKKESVIASGDTLRTHFTAFEYDKLGNETAIIEAAGDPDQKITRRTYNSIGEVRTITKPDGVVIHHRYDGLGRLSSLKASDETVYYTYQYDRNDNITEAFDHLRSFQSTRNYDESGRVAKETMGSGHTFSYCYDPLGRLERFVLPDRSEISYRFDAGYLREIHRGGYVHKDRYALSGKRIESLLGGNLGRVEYTYDSCLRPQTIKSPYLKMEMSYDALSRAADVNYADSFGEFSDAYHYDDLNQLTSENGFNYTFDSLGNRLTENDIAYEVNGLNQLTKRGVVEYTHDLNGNRISENDRTYAYDALDRLIEVIDAGMRTTYAYDPFHRRIEKSCYLLKNGEWEIQKSERYLYQGDKEIGSLDQEGKITELRIMGLGVGGDVGAAVYMELHGKAYVPLHDYRGNVSTLIDPETGTFAACYRYSAYGIETASFEEEEFLNPWRFGSKRVDPETGWSYFGARYYDPLSGRWTTPDPLWFVDGTNLYCYVQNNPANYIDPDGLFWIEFAGICAATIAAVYEWCVNNVEVNFDDNGNYAVQASHNTNGWSWDRNSCRVRPNPQSYSPFHVAQVNGVFNSKRDSIESFEMLCSLAEDCSTSFVYNSTHGLWDLIEAGINFCGGTTRPVSLMHQEWDEYFKNCPYGIFIQVCHSQGAIITRNALESYDEELRKRIHVIAVAPAAYIDQKTCGSVVHFVSRNDFIPMIDVKGRWKNKENIVILEPHKDASFFDHSIKSPTYRQHIRDSIIEICRNHGSQQ